MLPLELLALSGHCSVPNTLNLERFYLPELWKVGSEMNRKNPVSAANG